MTVKPFSRLNYAPRNYNIIAATMVPTYSVSASSSSINEGTTVTYTITTQYVVDGTILYWTTSGTTVAADFSGGVTSGSVTITGNTGTVTITLVSDITTEGAETIVFELRTLSTAGSIVYSTPSGTVNDTSVLTITPSTSSVNEGSSVTWTISAVGFGTGTLYYTNSGTTSAADFIDGLNSGSIAITADSGTLTKTLLNDLSTEGSETIIIQIRTGSTSGTIVGTSSTVTVVDTSVSIQPYSVKFNGSTQYLSIASTAVSNFGTSDFTVEGWFYNTSISTLQGLYDGRPLGTSTGAYPTIFVYTSQLRWYTNAGHQIISSTLVSNTWYHFAIVRISGSTKMYINGVQSGSTFTDATTYINGASTIGYSGGDSNYPFYGYISNFRIVKGTGVYTANFTPPTDTLPSVAGTSLLLNGATISDSSGNSLSITNTGTTITTTENPFGNYSMYFSGSTQNLSVSSASAFAFGSGVDFTVEAWIYPTAYGSSIYGASIVGTTSGSNAGWSFNLGQSSTTFRLITNASGTWADLLTASSGITLNQWTHVALVRSGGTLTIYKDGINVGSLAGTSAYTFTAPNSIGYIGYMADASNGSRYFTGWMSNVRVVNGTAVYTANFTPSTAPLAAITNTSFLSCQYAELLDASTNHLSITNTGTAVASAQNPFGNYYAAFNGSTQYLTAPYNSGWSIPAGGAFCMEAWVYCATPVDAYEKEIMAFNHNAGSGVTGWGFVLDNGGRFPNISYNATGQGGSLFMFSRTTYTNISPNVWAHVAITRDSSGAARSFINGVLNGYYFSAQTTGSGAAMAGASGSLYIGAPSNLATGGFGTVFFYPGNMTNVRLVNGSIPTDYVTSATTLGTQVFTPSTTPLTTVTDTKMLTLQYDDIVDSSALVSNISNFNSVKTYLTDTFTGSISGASQLPKNYSLSLNGSTQYASITSTAISNFGTSDFTVEGWFYSNSISTLQGVYDGRPLGTSTGAYPSVFIETSTLKWYTNAGTQIASSTLLSNTWYHFAFVRISGSTKMYINGTQAGSTYTDATTYVNGASTIGYLGGNSAYPFNGYISNFRIVKGTGVYTTTFTPSTTPLKAITNTSLLTAQYNTLFDASSNKFAITRVANADMVNAYPFP